MRYLGEYSDGLKQWVSKNTAKEWAATSAKAAKKKKESAMAKGTTIGEDKRKKDNSDEDIGDVLDGIGAWLYPRSEPSTYWPDEGLASVSQVEVKRGGALYVAAPKKRTEKEIELFSLGKQIAVALPDLVAKLAGELGISPQDVAQKLCEKLVLSLAERAGVDVKRPQPKAHTPQPRRVDVSLEAERAMRAALERQRSPVVTEPSGVIPSTHTPPPGWLTMAAKAYDEYQRTHPDTDDDDEAVANELEAK